MFTTPALIAALAVLVPILGVIAWYDLKYLRIPNWSVLAVLASFLVIGAWGLRPIDSFFWRLLFMVMVFAVFFALYVVQHKHLGGGDVKLLAAIAPFVLGPGFLTFLLTFAIFAILGIVAHRILRYFLGGRLTGWKAIDQKIYLPMGLIFGFSTLVKLGAELAGRLA